MSLHPQEREREFDVTQHAKLRGYLQAFFRIVTVHQFN